MSLTREQKDNIGNNINILLTSSQGIIQTVASGEKITVEEMRNMEIVAAANMTIAICTLAMFFLENADESLLMCSRKTS